MEFNDYQKQCKKTDMGKAAQNGMSPGFLYYVLGLAGETGELVEKIKKLFRDKGGVIDDDFRYVIKKELGDIQWYAARLADSFDIEFNDVATSNIQKLQERFKKDMIHGDGDNREEE
jgi:NTP pyrophosphatase (non-canonical NTP hydrolase)